MPIDLFFGHLLLQEPSLCGSQGVVIGQKNIANAAPLTLYNPIRILDKKTTKDQYYIELFFCLSYSTVWIAQR